MLGKKNTVEGLIKLFESLSDEEKKKFLDSVSKDADTEAEEKEEAAVEAETETEAPETPAEDTEEAPKEEAEEEVKEEGDGAAAEETETTEDTPAEDVPETAQETVDEQTADNTAEVIEGLTSRVSALEESLKEFSGLKELMEKFTKAQADKFGYSGTVLEGKTDFKEMSADEMKSKILSGEI